MTFEDDLDALHNPAVVPPDKAGAAWRMTLTPDHADVETGPLDAAARPESVGNWDGVLRHFGLDPAEFEVVENLVKMSSWQQSKGLEDGTRSTVWLYAYKARFRRITNALPAVDVDALAERVRKWKPLVRKTPGAGLGAPATFYVGWADWQTAKGPVDLLQERVLDSITAALCRVRELRKAGRNVTSLCVANMGDPIEGCGGAYESQLFTIQATKRVQLNVVLDLWTTGLRELVPHFDDALFVSVLSNHGEWTRPPGGSTKPVTSDSDNADGFLAETLRRVLSERADMGNLRWSIPNDEMVTAETLSGVTVGFTHGHKMPGSAKEADWLRAQSLRLRYETGAEPRLWMTGHRHHLDVRDFGFAHRIQHTTLEAAPSKWFTDATGLWSTPGTLTALIGEHAQAGGPLSSGGIGWSDLSVLPAAV